MHYSWELGTYKSIFFNSRYKEIKKFPFFGMFLEIIRISTNFQSDRYKITLGGGGGGGALLYILQNHVRKWGNLMGGVLFALGN
jgi:hypothetical protein